MRSTVVFAGLLLAILATGACSRAGTSPVTDAASVLSGSMLPAGGQAGPRLARAYAGLPDRGELLDYPQQAARRDGAYTWHRTELSEAHALHAIADKHLRITTPSGRVLDIRYDRHEEHASGDWTWIGHIDGEEGEQTILTFGEHAAFGSIAQPGSLPLRLTTRNGVTWLVETDPTGIANTINSATRPRHQDFVVPPKLRVAASSGGTQMSGTPAVAAATAAVPTVDLVIGYTPAFATDNGGNSGALTHLNYLVDVANVAYANSQIPAKVRLVGTVVVNYPDATSNDSTIDQLTGYDSTTQTVITPNAAFNGLRAARDQYGADLVSFVRSFREPENGGCGVAWLIGGGRSGIQTSDAPFGYSVVSDGVDAGADGRSYYCLDESLAHEMGHNMGAAHDVATAKGDNGVLDASEYGAFTYSFGYKSSVPVNGGSAGFYTVMAYGDNGQHIYRIFSDPRSTFCGGNACGTSQADNAQTLTNTIPTIASFRATVVTTPPPTSPRLVLKELDANGDGRSDLLLRSNASEWTATWFMAGTSRIGSNGFHLSSAYVLAATGDLNGDRRTDLIWTSPARDVVISMSTGTGYSTSVTPYTYDANTQIVGAASITGNGKADILLRNAAAGKLYVWYMDGTTRLNYNAHVIGSTYELVGSGDLNHDGKQDLVWTSNRRDILLSLSTGWSFETALQGGTYSTDYELVGVNDVNGGAGADLLFRSTTLGRLAIWFMDGRVRVAASSKPMPTQYRLVGKGDFNGDHRGDLVWTDASGHIVLSLSTGTNFSDSILSYAYASGYALMDAG